MNDPSPGRAPRRSPVFALLLAGAVSEFGNVLTFVAVPWFVLETTGSAARTGLTGGAVTLAVVAAGIFGGPIVDRLGFKRTSVLADLASGATVAAIPLLYHTVGLAYWQLLVLVFLGALLDAPGLTARQSMAPDLAQMAGIRTERVNSALQAIQQSALLLGPPAAGVLIAVLTTSNVLWLDAATFAVSAAAIASLVPALAGRSAGTSAGDRGSRRYLIELAEGLRFVRRDPVSSSTIPISVGLNFLIAPVLSVALPVLADRAYESATSLGLMLGGYGGGALAGAVLFGLAGHRLPRRATFVVLLFVQALPLWALAAGVSLPVAVVALALMGFGVGPVNPLIYTAIQKRTPTELLGRVQGASGALAMAAVPPGMVLVGYALEVAGLRPTLIAVAACYLAVAAYALLNPALKEMDAPPQSHTQQHPAAPGHASDR